MQGQRGVEAGRDPERPLRPGTPPCCLAGGTLRKLLAASQPLSRTPRYRQPYVGPVPLRPGTSGLTNADVGGVLGAWPVQRPGSRRPSARRHGPRAAASPQQLAPGGGTVTVSGVVTQRQHLPARAVVEPVLRRGLLAQPDQLHRRQLLGPGHHWAQPHPGAADGRLRPRGP